MDSDMSKAGGLVRSCLEPFGLPPETLDTIIAHLHKSPELYVDFLMQYRYGLSSPNCSRPYISAATIATSYFFGGFLPLLPYMLVGEDEVSKAFGMSVCVMVVALFLFGFAKTCAVRGWSTSCDRIGCLRGGFQMLLVGGIAATAAMGLVKAVS